ncbi:MAG: YceI family protein [Telluria sp.]
MKIKHLVAAFAAASTLGAGAAVAADTYKVDPNHTYPSFEADHGISFWRGKFKKTEGSVTLDRMAKTGTIDIIIDTSSVDFGHDGMNAHAKKADILDVTQFPTATFKAKSIKFTGDVPTSADGEFTLRGVTKPLTLTINKFKCFEHPQLKREVCGADASAQFNRGDFGVNIALTRFSPEVKLAIQVEAVKQ